jgi:1,4-alpha-glucan branching enzyme
VAGASDDRAGYYVLILHTHLPFVLGHGRWPHGSDWLHEVVAASYLPLVQALSEAASAGCRVRVTVDVSPVLVEQMASPLFRTEFEEFVRTRLQWAQENARHFDATGESRLAALARRWEHWYRQRLQQFEEAGGDVVGVLRRLADREVAELMTCAATHGYLPLLGREESVALQLSVAVATHIRHFRRRPQGIWLPECAYRPRYEWTPPVGPGRGQVRVRRRGLEEFLAQAGLRHFVTDSHLVRGGSPLSPYRDYYPALQAVAGVSPPVFRPDRSPYRAYRVASRGGRGEAAVLVRDPDTSMQVWSRHRGYPGDGWYLEFHKKHFPGGLRYWRVTGTQVDLGAKDVYDPDRAAQRVGAHADHFVGLLASTLRAARQAEGAAAVVCNPFDTELFGHWWYEGPAWLAEVFRRLDPAGVVPMRADEYLQAHPPDQTVSLLEGSWGEGGDHRVWLNRDTEWTWERVYAAEQTFWTLARRVRPDALAARRVLAQLARELLLLQASDWQFLITTWAARDYAEARFTDHAAACTRLAALLQALLDGADLSASDEEFLAARETLNFLFPNVLEQVDQAVVTPAA